MKNAAEEAYLNRLRDQHLEQERLNARLRDKIEGRKQGQFALGVAAFTLAMCLLWVVMRALVPTPATAPVTVQSEAPAADAATVARDKAAAALRNEIDDAAPAAERVIRNQFADPDGAQFRNVWAVRPAGFATGFNFCGEVNAKNGFGAYTGFQAFLVVGQTVATPRSLGDEGFARFCSQGTQLMEVTFD
jgi:hypothetical protein